MDWVALLDGSNQRDCLHHCCRCEYSACGSEIHFWRLWAKWALFIFFCGFLRFMFGWTHISIANDVFKRQRRPEYGRKIRMPWQLIITRGRPRGKPHSWKRRTETARGDGENDVSNYQPETIHRPLKYSPFNFDYCFIFSLRLIPYYSFTGQL